MDNADSTKPCRPAGAQIQIRVQVCTADAQDSGYFPWIFTL